MQGGIKNQLNNGIYNAIGLVPTRVINSAIRLYISHQRDTWGRERRGDTREVLLTNGRKVEREL